MRTLRLLSIVGICVLLASAAPAAEGLVFQADYAKARKQAEKAGKGMVVEFETAWCPFCRAMEKKTFPDEAVVEAASKLVLAKVDADTQTVLAKKFRVGEEFPLFIFLDKEGRELFRVAGYQPPTSFARALESVADPGSELQKAQRAATAEPKDAGTQAALGDALYEVGAVGQASDAYGAALQNGLEGEAAERAASRCAEHARDLERWAEARELYEKLLKEHPDSDRHPFYHLGLVDTYLAAGQEDRAQEQVARLAAEHPAHPACIQAGKRFVETPRNLGRDVPGEELFEMACAACHERDRRLVGPPLREIASLYEGNPEGIADWVRSPGKRREGYAAMPAQDAEEEYLMAIAKYILEAGR